MAIQSVDLARAAHKTARLAALIVLTMIIIGPAVPIDIAVLMAATLLSVFEMAGSGQVRATVLRAARTRLAEVAARINPRLR